VANILQEGSHEGSPSNARVGLDGDGSLLVARIEMNTRARREGSVNLDSGTRWSSNGTLRLNPKVQAARQKFVWTIWEETGPRAIDFSSIRENGLTGCSGPRVQLGCLMLLPLDPDNFPGCMERFSSTHKLRVSRGLSGP
jgi:hypothetical protein